MMLTPKMRPSPDLRGGAVEVIGAVAVGDGVMDGLGVGVTVTGLGVSVDVAGGATRRSNFCPGRITDALFNPFQAIRSASGTPYQPAIHESVSPLLTVW
jgi:hypothetical protein